MAPKLKEPSSHCLALPATLTGKEKRTLVLAILTLLLRATSAWNDIPIWVSCLLVASLLASPGIGILKPADLRRSGWPNIIWMRGILTITDLMNTYPISHPAHPTADPLNSPPCGACLSACLKHHRFILCPFHNHREFIYFGRLFIAFPGLPLVGSER